MIEDVTVAPWVNAACVRIEAHLGRPVVIDRGSIALGASVGIAVRRPGQREPEAIMREADASTYRARIGRGITVRGSL